jgi:hypothetical protein
VQESDESPRDFFQFLSLMRGERETRNVGENDLMIENIFIERKREDERDSILMYYFVGMKWERTSKF